MECPIFFSFLQQKIHVVISAVFKTKQSLGWGPGITSRSVAATIIMERKFANLIYLLSWRIIKRLPSGCLLERCRGRRWMAMVSGCQDINLLQGQVGGRRNLLGRRRFGRLVCIFRSFNEIFSCLSKESLKRSSCSLSCPSKISP